MQVRLQRLKKWLPVSVVAMLALIPVNAFAAATATGGLAVSATVTSSIVLTFLTASSGVTLSGSGTNAATLPFGNISAYGTLSSNVTRTAVTATTFTVSTPVLIAVTDANGSSANFTLNAQLNAADSVNAWSVGGVTVTSGAAASITASGAYGSTGTSENINITVPFTTASSTAISNTINFTATAN